MSYTTLWEVPDRLWEKIERILPAEKPAGSVGRPALPNRQVVNGILFILRSGCQWKGLKKEWYGASSSLHERFQTWNEAGLWKKIYRVMVKYYHKKRHIQWRWQAVDSKMVPAPLGGDFTGPNPTDRAKSGSKRHLWVDQRGAPLSIHVTSANAHDVTAILNLINRPIVRRPKPNIEFIICVQIKPMTQNHFERSYTNESSHLTSASESMPLMHRHHHLKRRNTRPDVGSWNGQSPGKMIFVPCASVGQRNPAIG